MSNCIVIVGNDKIALKNKDFETFELKRLIEAVPDDYDKIPKEDYRSMNIWWFVKYNTVFKGDTAIISIGGGKSQLTWRDLRWLFWFLGTLQRWKSRELFVTLRVKDEYDGFKKVLSVQMKIGEN